MSVEFMVHFKNRDMNSLYACLLNLCFTIFMQYKSDLNVFEFEFLKDESQYMSFPTTRNKKQGEPYDHMKDAAFFYDVTEQFKKGMKLDPQIKGSYEVTTISKVRVSDYLFASILVCDI